MAYSMLNSLPPELWHTISSDLDIPSLFNARIACRTLAIHSVDQLGDEIPLVFYRDKLAVLAEIATHPVLSKRIRFYTLLAAFLNDRTGSSGLPAAHLKDTTTTP